MTFYNLGHVVGADGAKGDKGDTGPKGSKGDKGDNAPLTNTVSANDSTHSVTPKGVYDYVNNLIGNLEDDMLR